MQKMFYFPVRLLSDSSQTQVRLFPYLSQVQNVLNFIKLICQGDKLSDDAEFKRKGFFEGVNARTGFVPRDDEFGRFGKIINERGAVVVGGFSVTRIDKCIPRVWIDFFASAFLIANEAVHSMLHG